MEAQLAAPVERTAAVSASCSWKSRRGGRARGVRKRGEKKAIIIVIIITIIMEAGGEVLIEFSDFLV